MATYEIAQDRKSITCLLCGSTSHHPEDVRHAFCARCKVFHELIMPSHGIDPTGRQNPS